MRYIPATKSDIKEMLKEIGVDSIDELFQSIPEPLRLRENLNLSSAMSELELARRLQEFASKNNGVEHNSSFLGAGCYRHFIPSVINHIVSRSEFYTSYTPYQPEISQGTLQAIFEFQSLICMLTGMDVTNASMYDGASSLAEAALMASRVTKKKELIVSHAIHPDYRNVLDTCLTHLDIKIKTAPVIKEGLTDLSWIKKEINDQCAAVLIQNPNFFGIIENIEPISEIAHKSNALQIVSIAEPVSLGILKPPGEMGVDIVTGEGQPLGIPMNFGGPSLGLFAIREKFVRSMPGRLVGETVDSEKRRGYVLTLATREQHIRRERATSNICTNQGLCALMATVYLSTMGKIGMKEVAEQNIQKANYAKKRLSEINGVQLKFSGKIFNEFVIKTKKSPAEINSQLLKHSIIGGLDLEKYYPDLKNCMLFCVTEYNTKEEIDKMTDVIANHCE
tara:strand:+ start:706 stop:2055 length:1350 start_codon:yes stop_codon:yes gene_type:complete